MNQQEPPQIKMIDGEWMPYSDQVAVRLRKSCLSGKSLQLPATQVGIVFSRGKIQAITQGRVNLESFWQKYLPWFAEKNESQLYLIRNSLISQQVMVADAVSASGDKFCITYKYLAEIENFEAFCNHFFQATDVVTTEHLECEPQRVFTSAIKAFVRTVPSSDLATAGNELLLRIVDEIKAQVDPVADRLGIRLAHISVPEISSESVDALTEKRRKRESDLSNIEEMQRYEREKHNLHLLAYELQREVQDFEFDKTVEQEDNLVRLQGRLNEIRAKDIASNLRIASAILQAIEKYREGARKLQETQVDDERKRKYQLEDEARLRDYLLKKIEIERSTELEDLLHAFCLRQLENHGIISQKLREQRQMEEADQHARRQRELEEQMAQAKAKNERREARMALAAKGLVEHQKHLKSLDGSD
jgi:hypothetical protein